MSMSIAERAKLWEAQGGSDVQTQPPARKPKAQEAPPSLVGGSSASLVGGSSDLVFNYFCIN